MEIAMNKPVTPALSRRGVLAGAGAVGAAAVAATALSKAVAPAAEAVVADATARPAPEQGGGYHVTPHVLQYYQTTRV
jgi:hypothetical protein